MAKDMRAEIRNSNLNYLLLAQQMLHDDRATAIYRLGIGPDVAKLISDLSIDQIIKLANSDKLLIGFMPDGTILDVLTKYVNGCDLAKVQASILMAGQQPKDEIN